MSQEQSLSVIHCWCGNTLASRVAGGEVIEMKHKGRRAWGIIFAIECEQCSRIAEPRERARPDIVQWSEDVIPSSRPHAKLPDKVNVLIDAYAANHRLPPAV